MHVAHRAGIGVGVVLLITVAVGVIFVGYRFYSQTTKPFRFHYFKVRFVFLISPLSELLWSNTHANSSG